MSPDDLREIERRMRGLIRDGKDGRDGLDGEDGKPGAAGRDGARGNDGARGERGLRGESGVAGRPGEQGTQGKAGERGPRGEVGAMPEHEWRDTKLRFERPDGEWGDWVDLEGPRGLAGRDGMGGGVIVQQGSSVGGYSYFPGGWV